MEFDLSKLPSERIIRIQYEDFCRNPEDLVRNVKVSINAAETKNSTRPSFEISRLHAQNQAESDLLQTLRTLKK